MRFTELFALRGAFIMFTFASLIRLFALPIFLLGILYISFMLTGCDHSGPSVSVDRIGCDVERERFKVGNTMATRTTVDCRGPAGPVGPAGADGADGTDGADGRDGLDGADGLNGADGLDGTSCSVAAVSGGAEITCGDSVVFVPAGADGADGSDGADGADAIVDTIFPCLGEDDVPTLHDEVLLRTSDGRLLAYTPMHGGYLTTVPPGTYQTTDQNACLFTVTADLDVIITY